MIMDENKMNEALEQILENLTDEQKEQVKACKSADDLMKLLDEWNVELTDTELDQVAGGLPRQIKIL